MKNLINAVLFLAVVGIVFTSCENDAGDAISNEFDYSLYNNKESLFSTLEKTNLNKYSSKSSGSSEFENAIEIINEEYGTNVYVTDFDQFLIDNPAASIDDILQENYISQEDYNVITSFFNDLITYDFDESIENLESRILTMNLNPNAFEKYNFLVNNLMVINDYYSNQGIDIFYQTTSNKALAAKMGGGCAVAIASNAVSTIGLATCGVPGPWCALAIVAKGLSLAGTYFSC